MRVREREKEREKERERISKSDKKRQKLSHMYSNIESQSYVKMTIWIQIPTNPAKD